MEMGVITGYTLYVNGNLWGIYDTYEEAWKHAKRYGRWNDIDILPMWRFIEEGVENVDRAA